MFESYPIHSPHMKTSLSLLTSSRFVPIAVSDPLGVPLIVCGDFNSGDDCGATRYLEEGFIDETHREDNTPVTSGRKDMPLEKPLVDVSSLERATTVPPTMVVAELITQLVEGGDAAYENPTLSRDVLEKLERIFTGLASGRKGDDNVMTKSDVERYLIAINGIVGRGSEFREAARQMGYEDSKDEVSEVQLPTDGYLTLPNFQAIYDKELKQGKFWGIAYDLAILGEPIKIEELFQSRFDRIYASDCLSVHSVMDFSSDKPCPNELCPSDHLPLAALFTLNDIN